MGVDTKGFIPVTKEPDVFNVAACLEETLTELFQVTPGWIGMRDHDYQRGQVSFWPTQRSFAYHFKHAGASRQLSVHFSCHSDHSEVYKGKKLTISLSCDEQAQMLIPLFLTGLKKSLGAEEAWYNPCDSGDEWTMI
jgi:hypothetical protein